jgi:hypothetical protein
VIFGALDSAGGSWYQGPGAFILAAGGLLLTILTFTYARRDRSSAARQAEVAELRRGLENERAYFRAATRAARRANRRCEERFAILLRAVRDAGIPVPELPPAIDETEEDTMPPVDLTKRRAA